MINFKNKKILAISPHTDDIEFWSSGLILKNNENTIHHITFSLCPLALTDDYTEKDAHEEWIKAQEFMGIDNYNVYGFPERRFLSSRQDILDILYKKSKRFNPDIVLAPSVNEIHQDHVVVGKEAIRAFPHSTIIQYVGASSIISNNYNLFCHLSEDIMNKKIELMNIFKSQLNIKPYDKYVINAMKYFGSIFQKKYVEPFVCYRIMQR